MNEAWHREHRMPARATVDQRLAWHLAHERACACRPVPRPLERVDDERTRARLRQLLDGQDSRSLAQSAAARSLVDERPSRVAALAALAEHANWVVAMRAFDLLEKIARVHPDWIQPHRSVFLRGASSEHWLIRLQVVRALPLMKWTPRQRIEVILVLTRDVNHEQTFVRAWSLDGLATLALADSALMPRVKRALAAFEHSGSAALRARARHIRARLTR